MGHKRKKVENHWTGQRDRAGKDVQPMRIIKNENDNVMVNSEAVLKEMEGVL